MKVEEITEYVVFGLSNFAKYNAVKFVYGDEQGDALRKRMGVGPKAIGRGEPERGGKWSDTNVGEFDYNGKTVTASDANKVLLRWKLADGRYRVIFGDLKAETVSPERLAQWESK